MKKIAILGSTGSIGTQTLSVIEEHADDFEVTALACGNNIRLLEEQMRKFRPKLVAVWSKEAAASLRGPHGGSGHSCGNRNGWITCGCNL